MSERNLFTHHEAKEKICPQRELVMAMRSDGGLGKIGLREMPTCRSSRCMAWVWAETGRGEQIKKKVDRSCDVCEKRSGGCAVFKPGGSCKADEAVGYCGLVMVRANMG